MARQTSKGRPNAKGNRGKKEAAFERHARLGRACREGIKAMGDPDLVIVHVTAKVAEEAAAVGDGRLAVLVAAARVDELRTILGSSEQRAPGVDDLDAPVTVLTVHQAKGLEFDAVVLVDPAAIVAESPRGLNDLYVALTRTTHRLSIVHPGDLPDILAADLA